MESKLLWLWGILQPCSQVTHSFLFQRNTYLEELFLEKLRRKKRMKGLNLQLLSIRGIVLMLIVQLQ